MTSLERLHQADLVVAVGSVDGVLTTAAFMRLFGRPGLEVCFTQAFQVDRLPVGEWAERKVVFIDLAVNNRQPSMTAEFVEKLRAGGNALLAVIDEHNRQAWLEVLGSFDGLAIEPQSQQDGGPGSSGEVLRRALLAAGMPFDAHTNELLAAADEADRGNFLPWFGKWVNEATKSAIQDNSRRVHLAELFSQQREPDDQVWAWRAEYEEMEANLARLLSTAVTNLSDGIVRVDTGGAKLDVTSFLFALYKRGRVAVVTGGQAYNPAVGAPAPTVFIATGDKGLDVLATLKAAGIAAGGFAQKASIDPADEQAAIAAIRAAIS